MAILMASEKLKNMYNKAKANEELDSPFLCPIFQKELYYLARELVKPVVDGFNRNINLTLCEVENYMEEEEEIEYDYLAEQLYDDVYCYVNGVHSSKYFWYKDIVKLPPGSLVKPGKILFTNCTMRKDMHGIKEGAVFPAIELDYLKMVYTFFRKEFNYTTDKFYVEL